MSLILQESVLRKTPVRKALCFPCKFPCLAEMVGLGGCGADKEGSRLPKVEEVKRKGHCQLSVMR